MITLAGSVATHYEALRATWKTDNPNLASAVSNCVKEKSANGQGPEGKMQKWTCPSDAGSIITKVACTHTHTHEIVYVDVALVFNILFWSVMYLQIRLEYYSNLYKFVWVNTEYFRIHEKTIQILYSIIWNYLFL